MHHAAFYMLTAGLLLEGASYAAEFRKCGPSRVGKLFGFADRSYHHQ
jgi:hypothetical protein